MPMYSLLKTRSGFWHRLISIISLVVTIALVGCTTFQESVSSGENQRAFIEALAGTPAARQDYRQAYVSGFRDHVKALAANDTGAQEQTKWLLSDNRKRLNNLGVSEADCSRPYCIIEPLQGGRLNSWCGYRLEADEGTDLYQWLDWGTVQTALQGLQ